MTLLRYRLAPKHDFLKVDCHSFFYAPVNLTSLYTDESPTVSTGHGQFNVPSYKLEVGLQTLRLFQGKGIQNDWLVWGHLLLNCPVKIRLIRATRDLIPCWWEWKMVWQFLIKVNMYIPRNPVIPILDIYPRWKCMSTKWLLKECS